MFEIQVFNPGLGKITFVDRFDGDIDGALTVGRDLSKRWPWTEVDVLQEMRSFGRATGRHLIESFKDGRCIDAD